MHCYGGMGYREFYQSLKTLDDPQGVNLIVACPGRYDSSFYILDFIDSFQEHIDFAS